MVSNIVTEAPPVRTQFLIFTLFWDYVIPRSGSIWTSSLLDLMAHLDVSEPAVRSTLSRMMRKGWVASEKHGRHSRYRLTPRGRALLERGAERIFEPIFTGWDGEWRVVVYSLPETKRRKRHILRKQLAWLGFGSLAPGTWCSPHSRRQALHELFADLEVEDYVDVFAGAYMGPSTGSDLVERCWDLEGLEAQYNEFIDRYEVEYELCAREAEAGALEPRVCFIRRFWLTHDFQSFPQTDPNLPVELLPEGWIGFKARALFENYNNLLGAQANQFVNEVIESFEP